MTPRDRILTGRPLPALLRLALPIPVVGALLRILLVAAGFAALAGVGILTPVNALRVVAAGMVIYGGAIALGLAIGPWRAQVPREPAGRFS